MAKPELIIKTLESIDAARFHGLMDDLLFAGGLLKENLKLEHILIDPTGWNPSKMKTISSPTDSRLVFHEGFAFEYSTREDWHQKLKEDVRAVKAWAIQESQEINYFVFATNRDVIDRLMPKAYIEQELRQFKAKAFVISQKSLLNPLGNSDFFYIRRRWLNITDDYFQSLERFRQHHLKQAQARHIYLECFQRSPWYDESIEVIRAFISGDERVLVINSKGGVGKTRFVLEACEQIQQEREFQNLDFLFNRWRKSVDIDDIIHEISKGKESLIILDDAHVIDNLADFRAIFSERDNAKIVLTTRSTALEHVKHQIGIPAKQLELQPLDKEGSINLLKANLKYRTLDEDVTITASLCEGNPLLIGISAHLINSGAVRSFHDLKKHDLISSYFQQILVELKQSKSDISLIRYEPFLALVFLLRPFSIYDTEARALIRKTVGIDEVQEGFILRDLEKNGILERHGDTFWIYLDLLGEYLVESIFFSETPILDFEALFQELTDKSKETVFQTLRELNNHCSNLFLKSWADDLYDCLESQNNDQRYSDLKKLEIIASRVTDETLKIIRFLSSPDNEKRPAKYRKSWPYVVVGHDVILIKCLDVLDNPHLKYLYFDDTLEILQSLSFYKTRSRKYRQVREKAATAITKIASYNLRLWEHGWGYEIQKRMVLKIIDWKKENLGRHMHLILKVCQELLSIEITGDYFDDPKLTFAWRPVVVSGDLRKLRNDVMDLLKSIFSRVRTTPNKVEVLKILGKVTQPYMRGDYGKELRNIISHNANSLIDFYKTVISRKPGALVLQEIEKQAYWLKKYKIAGVDLEAVDKLIFDIQSDEFYHLYSVLVDTGFEFLAGGSKTLDEVRQGQEELIRELTDSITSENMEEWLRKLDRVAETYSSQQSIEFAPFNQLLIEIGISKPGIAKAIIDLGLSGKSHFGPFIRWIMRGIRQSSRKDIADDLANQWLESEDFQLVLEIPSTYWRVPEKHIRTIDISVFERLLELPLEDLQQRQRLDREIMNCISWLYISDVSRALHIIHQLYKRAKPDDIPIYIRNLRIAQRTGSIDVGGWSDPIFHDIIQTLVEVSLLDYDAIYILSLYGQRFPLQLVDFFEKRVIRKKQRNKGIADPYDAIPPHIPDISEMYQSHPDYSQVISRILDWFIKGDHQYSRAARELLWGISPNFDDVLKEKLLEFIKSGEEQRVVDAVRILDKYRKLDITDQFLRKAIKFSKGSESVEAAIRPLIIQGVAWGKRGMINFWQSRIEQFRSWSNDENQYVRDFAKDLIKRLELLIEGEEKRIDEEEVRRRKGL